MRRKGAISHLRSFSVFVLAVLSISVACSRAPQTGKPASPDNESREFQGTWIATGNRQSISLGKDRRASIAELSGSLLLSGPSRPTVGFLADALVLNDTAMGTTGRAVWTDDHGDHIYSELKGEATATGSKISGNFIGGTGPYAGATGSYEFSWRFVIDTEDGLVHGQSEGLTGRIKVGTSPRATDTGNTR
jgi:hypothetical protein